MCDCVVRIEEGIKANNQSDYKKQIQQVRCSGRFISMTDGRVRMSSTFIVQLEGQKKEERIEVVQSYCPFCGEKQYE